MLDHILSLLGGVPPTPPADDLQLAVAALLVEAARMDDRFEPSERAAIETVLARRFSLTAEDTTRLLAAAERAADASSQLFRFTQLIVERLSPEERIGLVEMLWEVVYADGVLDPDEDALLRRVAGLIYVPDQDRGAARKRVLRRLGVAED
jgi:uncharacterized tellurite resistance protein B-like protein